jgi:hypothetical protein
MCDARALRQTQGTSGSRVHGHVDKLAISPMLLLVAPSYQDDRQQEPDH